VATLLIDYAFTRAAAASIADAGYSGAIGYLSTDESKDISAANVADLHAHGLGAGFVWETTATRATGGFAAGQQDAVAARTQAHGLGAPAGTCLYFAVDEDATVSDIAAYFQGVYAISSPYLSGVYGSLTVVEGILAAGYAAKGWQTCAWSGEVVSSKAVLYQRQTKTLPAIAGVAADSYDEDVLLTETLADAGLWIPGATPAPTPAPPKPKPAPLPTPKAPAFPLPSGYYYGPLSGPRQSVSGLAGTPASWKAGLATWQQRMEWRGWSIAADGEYGSDTAAVTLAFQKEKGLVQDSHIGPQTWSAAWTFPVS
jgi:peptidoglycan hydrolase-like protein with peptidoglycan-binding domain